MREIIVAVLEALPGQVLHLMFRPGTDLPIATMPMGPDSPFRAIVAEVENVVRDGIARGEFRDVGDVSLAVELLSGVVRAGADRVGREPAAFASARRCGWVTAVTGKPPGARSRRSGTTSVGEQGDPLDVCRLAHAVADVQDDVREELVWDQRALAGFGHPHPVRQRGRLQLDPDAGPDVPRRRFPAQHAELAGVGTAQSDEASTVVVLPVPFGPMMPNISPRGTANPTSCSDDGRCRPGRCDVGQRTAGGRRPGC